MNPKAIEKLSFQLVMWLVLFFQGFTYIMFKMGPFDTGIIVLIIANIFILWGMISYARKVWINISLLRAVFKVALYEAANFLIFAFFVFIAQFLFVAINVVASDALSLILRLNGKFSF